MITGFLAVLLTIIILVLIVVLAVVFGGIAFVVKYGGIILAVLVSCLIIKKIFLSKQ